MLCNNCGFKNDSDSKYCIKCGYTLKPSSKKRVEDVLFVPQKESKKHKTNWFLIIFAIMVIVVVFIVLVAASENNSNNSLSNGDSISSKSKTDEWQLFSSVEHGFKINFPNYPSSDRTPTQKSDGFSYSSTQYSSTDNDGTEYLAQAADYDITPDYFDNKAGLEGMINVMNKPGEQEVTNSQFTTFKGYDAVTFNVFSNSEKYYMKGIAFVQDDLKTIKTFLLLVGSKINSFPNYQKFINSMEIN